MRPGIPSPSVHLPVPYSRLSPKLKMSMKHRPQTPLHWSTIVEQLFRTSRRTRQLLCFKGLPLEIAPLPFCLLTGRGFGWQLPYNLNQAQGCQPFPQESLQIMTFPLLHMEHSRCPEPFLELHVHVSIAQICRSSIIAFHKAFLERVE